MAISTPQSFSTAKTILLLFLSIFISALLPAQGFEAYYRYPDVYKNSIVFSVEGDLWNVPLPGGLVQGQTTHPEEERFAAISLDRTSIAFSASYDGSTEVLIMPDQGSLPMRRIYEGDASIVNNWTTDGKVVYQTSTYSISYNN
jgi:tricorn protease